MLKQSEYMEELKTYRRNNLLRLQGSTKERRQNGSNGSAYGQYGRKLGEAVGRAMGEAMLRNMFGSTSSNSYSRNYGNRMTNNQQSGEEFGSVSLEEAMKELDGLIGLDEVKSEIEKIKNVVETQKDRKEKGLGKVSISSHMVFTGNPGTGKTTVARIIGKILYAMGLLEKPVFIEASRQTLVGQFVGHTSQKTQAVIDKAMGGVLFIDEAYTLVPEGAGFDYGQEAIDTLLKEMEDNRDRFVVIVAGYEKEMYRFIKSNPGLESRFQTFIHFNDYNGEELFEVFKHICKSENMKIREEDAARVLAYFEKQYRKRDNSFSNGRMVRKFYETALREHANRISKYEDKSEEMLTTFELKDFGLDKDMPSETELETILSELNGLIGLKNVKNEINKLITYVQAEQIREKQDIKTTPISLHTVFTGNPGTGKTTVARMLGKIYRSLGIIQKDVFIEATRNDLVSPIVGKTSEKTMSVIDRAKGGILFIDEAYTLSQGEGGKGDTAGQEAIDTLLKAMEDYRESLVVIVAGYRDEMAHFIRTNPGLESRFSRYIEFEDYTGEELFQILESLCKQDGKRLDESSVDAIQGLLEKMYRTRTDRFGNGRSVRNMYQSAVVKQSNRIIEMQKNNPVTKDDLITLVAEDFGIKKDNRGGEHNALNELFSMTGLASVKKEITGLVALLKVQKEKEKRGIKTQMPSLHMVFTGNPGTGKTTVARYIARIFREMGILAEGQLIETDREGLVAGYIGQTEIKTKEVIENARGGVLFIDEAYTLVKEGSANDFGQDAIDTLLKAMEDYRESLVVIVAGYDEPIQRFINSNPGLSSRFNRYIHFDDYRPDEMFDIFCDLCHKEEYSLTDDAEDNLVTFFENINPGSFGNIRGVRNLFDKTKEAQARRLFSSSYDENALLLINNEDIESAISQMTC